MSTVVASYTTPNLDGVSRPALFVRLALDTGVLVTGTLTDGDTQNIYDTNQLKSAQLSPSEWIGGWVRMSSGSAISQIRPIVDFEPELGKIIVEPYFSASAAAADTYELWKVNPNIVLGLTDQCLLNELYLPCWTVLSEVPDYDMEQTHTTDWTATGSATVSKQTAQPRLGSSGKRYLRIVSAAAGDGAKSAVLRVLPGRTYHVSAVARASAVSTTAKLTLYDETNSVALQTYTSVQQFPARIWFTFQIPASCYSVTIRLSNVEASVTTEWDEVIFQDTSANDVPLPWWVKNDTQVKGIFQLQPNSIGDHLWDATLKGEDDEGFDVIPSFGGFSRFKAQSRQGNLTGPLFMFGSRNETAYSNDTTDLKYLDINLLCSALKLKLYKFNSQPMVTGLLDSANFKTMLGEMEHEYSQIAQAMSVDLNKTIDSPTPWVRTNNARFSYGEG